jgi:hypothetical protein
MKRLHRSDRFSIIVAITFLSLVGAAWAPGPIHSANHPADDGNKSAEATPETARDDGTLFTAFVSVLRHPRCINCHSRGDFPRQGDDGHPHMMNVRRGAEGHGVTAEKCSTCHQDHNLVGANMPPGAPNWGLPPANMPMIWQGLTDEQICRSIKDPGQNKNRNIEQLVEHLTEDKLVMWGWNPGEGRTPIPMPHDEFVAKVKRWQAAGAPCPTRTSAKGKP